MSVEVLIEVLAWLLVPMAILPVITAVVLFRHLNARSLALRERARIAQLLAVMAVTVGVIAARVVFNLDIDLIWVWVSFAVIVLAIDIASGAWLLAYILGRFDSD